MALWECRDCTAAYAVGIPACPHCGSTHHEEAGAMPKITVHGGPSIAPPKPVGSEQPSPGNNSSRSSGRKQPSGAPSVPSARSRARTAGSRSKQDQRARSSAGSTGGGQTATDQVGAVE